MNEFWILTIVVVIFATVQSLFGVGLLVFGTPTLLLLGYSFESTIAILLPASIAISFLQVITARQHLEHLKRDLFIFCVPFIVVGLTLVLTLQAVEMKLLIGIMLVVTALMRCHESTQRLMARWINKRRRWFMIGMGLVHGLSNMGGGLLTVFVSSTYQEKDAIRANIAYGYLIFATAQLAVLAVMNPSAFSVNSVVLPLISMMTYATVGSVLYLNSPKHLYQQLITSLILAYGAILILQGGF